MSESDDERAVDAFDGVAVSAQALRLHAEASRAAAVNGRCGLIGLNEAERLAIRCGAVVEELIEAGMWESTDLAYVINSLAV